MSEDVRRTGRSAHRRAARATAAVLLCLAPVLTAAGCGFSADTNQPQAPAEGTNLDVGAGGALKVRNLLVVSRAEGEGYISASLIGNTDDQLTAVEVTPTKPDGSSGAPVTGSPAAPLQLGGGSLVVLTNEPLITVESPDLMAGLAANVVLQFTNAGPVALKAPVVDGTLAPWSTISPTAAPSPSSTPSPSGTPS